MTWASECLEERHEAQGAPFGKVRERGSGRFVLQCNCRAKLVLVGRAAVWCSEQDHPGCGVCGERFAYAQPQKQAVVKTEDGTAHVTPREMFALTLRAVLLARR